MTRKQWVNLVTIALAFPLAGIGISMTIGWAAVRMTVRGFRARKDTTT